MKQELLSYGYELRDGKTGEVIGGGGLDWNPLAYNGEIVLVDGALTYKAPNGQLVNLLHDQTFPSGTLMELKVKYRLL